MSYSLDFAFTSYICITCNAPVTRVGCTYCLHIHVCVFKSQAHADKSRHVPEGEAEEAAAVHHWHLSPVCSTCECRMTPSLICCFTWWPRNGSWTCPSCSSQSTGACRTLNYNPNSSRSSAKGSSRLPWQQAPGYSLVGSTQVKHCMNLPIHVEDKKIISDILSVPCSLSSWSMMSLFECCEKLLAIK